MYPASHPETAGIDSSTPKILNRESGWAFGPGKIIYFQFDVHQRLGSYGIEYCHHLMTLDEVWFKTLCVIQAKVCFNFILKIRFYHYMCASLR